MEQGSAGQERRVVGVGRQGQLRPVTLRSMPDGRFHLQIGADEPVILTADGLGALRNHTVALLPATWSAAAEEPGEDWAPDFHGFGNPKRRPR